MLVYLFRSTLSWPIFVLHRYALFHYHKSFILKGGVWTRKSLARFSQVCLSSVKSDQVRLGCIGLGWLGSHLIDWLGSGQVALGLVGSSKVGLGWIGLGQVKLH
jgi:hypothetical protein